MAEASPSVVEAKSDAELRVRGLRLFASGKETLTFEVRRGEVLVVLGRNGSGKSLLINLLSGVYPVGLGVVRFGDDDLGSARGLRQARQRRFGVVFQQHALLRGLTVYENLALVLRLAWRARHRGWRGQRMPRAQMREEAAHLLALVGAERCENLYPHELSVGDQQCVALARALAGDKRVLLCDEPTADLGPDKAFQVDELIASLVRNGLLAAVVVCTQNLETAFRLGTRFLLLGDGAELGRAEMCESGTDLRARPAFQRLLRMPSETLFWNEDSLRARPLGAGRFGL